MPESHMNSYDLEATVPAAGAAVAQDTVLGPTPISGSVQSVQVVPEASVTANGTNFRTIRLVNKGQTGAGSTVVATLALDTPGTDDLTAYDAKDIPVVAGAVAAGDVLTADETVAGTGLAHSGYRIRVEITR